MINIASPKVLIPSLAFLTLNMTKLEPVTISLLVVIAYKIVSEAIGLYLTRQDLIQGLILSMVLNPRVISFKKDRLPVFFPKQINIETVIINSIIYGILIAILRR